MAESSCLRKFKQRVGACRRFTGAKFTACIKMAKEDFRDCQRAEGNLARAALAAAKKGDAGRKKRK